MSKRVTQLDPPRIDDLVSQPGSLFNEPKKIEPGPAHHRLAG